MELVCGGTSLDCGWASLVPRGWLTVTEIISSSLRAAGALSVMLIIIAMISSAYSVPGIHVPV